MGYRNSNSMPTPAYLLLIAAILFVFYKFQYYSTERTVTLTVNKLGITTTGGDGGGHKYMVYSDKGVFENTDDLWLSKFNSSDVYNRLQEGRQYRCRVVGWREPFLSMYPNIVSAFQVEP